MKYIKGKDRCQTFIFPVSLEEVIGEDNEIRLIDLFDYLITKKTIERASADIGLAFIAYNLRRIINIVGIKQFREYLNMLIFSFSAYKHYIFIRKRILELFKRIPAFFTESFQFKQNSPILVLK